MTVSLVGGIIQAKYSASSLATSGLLGIFLGQFAVSYSAFLTLPIDKSSNRSPSRSTMTSCKHNAIFSSKCGSDQPIASPTAKKSKAEKRAAKQRNETGSNSEHWQRTKANALQRRELFPPYDYSGCDGSETSPKRNIICADALRWLEDQVVLPGSVFTSMPDLSEIDMIVSRQDRITPANWDGYCQL